MSRHRALTPPPVGTSTGRRDQTGQTGPADPVGGMAGSVSGTKPATSRMYSAMRRASGSASVIFPRSVPAMNIRSIVPAPRRPAGRTALADRPTPAMHARGKPALDRPGHGLRSRPPVPDPTPAAPRRRTPAARSAPSTAINARPRARRARRTGGTANGSASRPSRHQGWLGTRTRTARNAPPIISANTLRLSASPRSTARVRLPTSASVCTSRRLLAISSAQASRPMPIAATAAVQRDHCGLDVGGAEHGDQAEEDEDEDLPEPRVAVRLGTAGVEPGGGHRGRSDRQQPPGGQRREGESGQRRPRRSMRRRHT